MKDNRYRKQKIIGKWKKGQSELRKLRNEEKHFKNHKTLFNIIFQKPLSFIA